MNRGFGRTSQWPRSRERHGWRSERRDIPRSGKNAPSRKWCWLSFGTRKGSFTMNSSLKGEVGSMPSTTCQFCADSGRQSDGKGATCGATVPISFSFSKTALRRTTPVSWRISWPGTGSSSSPIHHICLTSPPLISFCLTDWKDSWGGDGFRIWRQSWKRCQIRLARSVNGSSCTRWRTAFLGGYASAWGVLDTILNGNFLWTRPWRTFLEVWTLVAASTTE